MAPLRVLQIASGREINGALVYCQNLCRELAAAGHTVAQLCRPKAWLTQQPTAGFSRHESPLKRYPTHIRSLSRWIRSQQFDVIHTHMSSAHMMGILASWQTGIPVVATAHNQYLQLHWRLNDFVIANSDSTARFHRRVNCVPRDKIRPVFCLIDLDRFLNVSLQRGLFVRGEMRLRRNEFVVGVVGDLVARKGQYDAIRALSEIVPRIPQVRLVFVGRFHRRERYVQRIRRYQMKHDLLRRVKWLGIRPNIQDHLRGFDVCLVPSREEPMGMVAAEAQAAGTPVVATRVGGLPEIVVHEQTGLLVPPGDVRAMADAVIRLHDDRALADRLAAQARQSVQEMFSVEKLTNSVVDIYRHVIAARIQRRVG